MSFQNASGGSKFNAARDICVAALAPEAPRALRVRRPLSKPALDHRPTVRRDSRCLPAVFVSGSPADKCRKPTSWQRQETILPPSANQAQPASGGRRGTSDWQARQCPRSGQSSRSDQFPFSGVPSDLKCAHAVPFSALISFLAQRLAPVARRQRLGCQ